ncbi:hypothetical protein LTS18_007289, partial [Coniosporium uncinatum]
MATADPQQPNMATDTAQATSPTDSPSVSLDDLPEAGQRVAHDGKEYLTVKEGLAYILVPPNAPKAADPKDIASGKAQSQNVFYNEIMQYNRDLSVLAIRAMGEDFIVGKRARLQDQDKRKNEKRERRLANRASKTVQAAARTEEIESPNGDVSIQSNGTAPVTESRAMSGTPAQLQKVAAVNELKRKRSEDESAAMESKKAKTEEQKSEPAIVDSAKRLGSEYSPDANGHNKHTKDTTAKGDQKTNGDDDVHNQDVADEDLLAVESSLRAN